MKPLNPMQQHLKVIAAHDLGDAMDSLWAIPSGRAATLRAQPPAASSCKHDIPIAERGK